MDILKLAEGKHVIIYGAHLIGLELYRYFENMLEDFRFEGFAVTSTEGNPESLEGYKVRNFKEYLPGYDKVIFIAMPQKYHKDVESYARKCGFDDIYPVTQEKMEKLKGDWILAQTEKMPEALNYIYDDAYDKSWLDIAEKIQCEKSTELRIHFKCPTLFYKIWQSIADRTRQADLLEQYEHSFGAYHNLHALDCRKVSNGQDINSIAKIYMAFSRWDNGNRNNTELDSWIVPIQAGSVLTDEKADTVLDETGENISKDNRMLAEMTVAYWVWKNEQGAEYKGLCHYRRHFVIGEEEIRNLRENRVDVILTIPRYVPGGVGNMFLAETPVKQFVYDCMQKSIGELYPEEKERFASFLQGEFYFPNNMVVARKRVYDDYCSWIFPVIFKMYEKDLECGYGHEADRHLAYAAELLSSYYFLKYKDDYKIVVTDYKFYK